MAKRSTSSTTVPLSRVQHHNRSNPASRLVEVEIKICWDAMPDPAMERAPIEVQERMEELLPAINASPAKVLAEVQALAVTYPDLLCLTNWWWSCLRLLGRNEEAKQLTEKMLQQHPEYLFARLSLVELLMEERDMVQAERALFKDGITLPELYPDRDEFHITEVRLWLSTVAKLLIWKGDPQTARSYRNLLAKLEPDTPLVAELDRLLKFDEQTVQTLRMVAEVRRQHHPDLMPSIDLEHQEDLKSLMAEEEGQDPQLVGELDELDGPPLCDEGFQAAEQGAQRPLRAWCSGGLFTSGMGDVMVARTKSSGIEVGVFLVDAFCLGVKNCFYIKLSPRDFTQFLAEAFEQQTEVEVRPCYARKLVEGAVAYAGRFGLAPHSDYKKACRVLGGVVASECSATFEFGRDGKPFYVEGPADSPARVQQVLRLLNANCGPGNFHYMLALGVD